MKAKDISNFFARQLNLYEANADVVFVRIFNPHGIEEFFVLNIIGDEAEVVLRKESGGYGRSKVSLAEIAEIKNVEIDEFFKPKKTSEIYALSSLNFEQGGNIEVSKTHSSKYWDYISLISGKISDSINDEQKTNEIVSQNSELIKDYFSKSISVEDAVGVLLGLNKSNVGISIFYVQNNSCHSRKENFEENLSSNLKFLRAISAIKKGFVYGEVFSLQSENEITISESQALHFVDLIRSGLGIPESTKFCLVVCNYPESKKENVILVMSNMKFTAKHFIQLKSIIKSVIDTVRINVVGDFKFTIKQII